MRCSSFQQQLSTDFRNEDVNKQGWVKLSAPGSTPMMEAGMSAASAPRRTVWTLDLMSHGYYWQRIVMSSQENVLVQHKLNFFAPINTCWLFGCCQVASLPSIQTNSRARIGEKPRAHSPIAPAQVRASDHPPIAMQAGIWGPVSICI